VSSGSGLLHSQENLRVYYPDFVIFTKEGGHLIVETKGQEDIDVQYKDKRIVLWCEDATKLTKSKWFFQRMDQEYFEKYRFRSVQELISTLKDNR